MCIYTLKTLSGIVFLFLVKPTSFILAASFQIVKVSSVFVDYTHSLDNSKS